MVGRYFTISLFGFTNPESWHKLQPLNDAVMNFRMRMCYYFQKQTKKKD